MIRQVLSACVVTIALAFLVASCSDTISSPSTTTTTTTTSTSSSTTTTSVTENFEGTLNSGQSAIHVFHTLPGVFTVTLLTLEPSTVLPPVGFSFGMWDGTSCVDVLSTVSAVPNTVLTGTASIETDVCVRMWDPTPWSPTLMLSYTIAAVHYKKS
jgi:hypothetical protein